MAGDLVSSPHPIHPPHGEDDRHRWLRLLRSRRVGPATFYRLMAEHGSAAAALDALPEVARAAGVTDYQICPEGVVVAELKAARFAGARLAAVGEASYPAALSALDDPPPLLWILGDPALPARGSVSLVGARNASSLGVRMARALGEGLGKAGLVVTSGLARGVDTAAHQAALPTGTIAVMAGGVDVVYPAENAVLAQEIAERGLRVSEQPMGLVPQARHFPRRNRIIAGLSRAVVVVEAAARSGSLITANAALEAGREVMAVPGHPFDARASGCNMLIRDGALLVRGAEDVLAALADAPAPEARPPVPDAGSRPGVGATPRAPAPPAPEPRADAAPHARTATDPSPHRALAEAAVLHRQILARLGPSPLGEDQLIRDLAATAGDVGPALMTLELDGLIERRAGGLVALAVN